MSTPAADPEKQREEERRKRAKELSDRLEKLPAPQGQGEGLFAGFSKPQKGELDRLANDIEEASDLAAESRKSEFLTYPTGAVVMREGETGSEMFVVITGIATAFRTLEDGQYKRLVSFGPGDWFGEMTVMSNHPRTATIKTEAPTILLKLETARFSKLYRAVEPFRRRIDDRYRSRALSAHLRVAPLLKSLDQARLARIAEGADLVSYEEGTVIAKEGDEADALYLVRSGVVQRSNAEHAGRGLAYLRENTSFGERVLTSNRIWPATYRAATRVDIVRVPEGVFQRIFAGLDQERSTLALTASKLVASEEGVLGEEDAEMLLGKQAIKAGEALVIDQLRCTRCNACVESCVAVHEDRVPRLSKRGIKAGQFTLTSACYNCEVPKCMLACNFGAIRRDTKGSIHFLFDNCTGCTACEPACPFDVIRMANLATMAKAEAPAAAPSLLRRIPFLDRFLAPKPAPAAAATAAAPAPAPRKAPAAIELKAVKCDLCAGLPFEACVYNCPCDAIRRVPPEDLVKRGLVRS
jgi:CRP-like cAMP-binding protein/Fe-S-cluster-containing hydrogenase component 2